MLLPFSGIHHIALLVHDLERAEHFYHQLLQLPLARRWHESDGTPRSVWLHIGTSILMLEKATDSAPNQNAGWHLLALSMPAEERQQVLEYLAQNQIPITGQTSFTIYINDPEGNRIGLSSWPHQ